MRRSTLVLVFVAAAMLACSSGTKPAPPPTSYLLFFPSTNVAVAVDTVEVMVFDVPADKADLCNTLVVKRKSNQDLGPAIATTTPKALCDLLAGHGDVSVTFGLRAFLAVGRQGSNDFVLGCTTQQVGAGSSPPSIFLDYVSDTIPAAPASTCQSVSQKCGGGC